MIYQKYLQNKKKNIPRIKITLLKSGNKPGFILPFSFQIKNNPKTNLIINKEFNLKNILCSMFVRTNELYEELDFNKNDIKLSNEDNTKRSIIIKNIKDFIEINIYIKNSVRNKDSILCEFIYFFDLLIIQNKKCKNIISFEKIGLGALILILKFNKLHEKSLIKKYKSIFNDKYMTLDEINRIEVICLKMINYNIILPNPIYYIEILYKYFFLPSVDKEQNTDNIFNQIISIIKHIMTFSNNYYKFHAFYFSSFIIKFCFEQNKIDEFHSEFINFFDINMREYRILYDEFVKTFQGTIYEGYSLSKKENEIKPKRRLNNSLVYNKPLEMQISNNINNNINFACITITNGFGPRRNKRNGEKNNNCNISCSMKVGMNTMNNTYYKKFLENYIGNDKNNTKQKKNRNSSMDENKNNCCKIIPISDNDYKIINIRLESPKNCGISIDYRLKKKNDNKILDELNNNEKNIFINKIRKEEEGQLKIRKNFNQSMDNTKIKKEQKEYGQFESEKPENENKKSKRLNSGLMKHNIFYKTKGDSIRKIYKSKTKAKDPINNLINEKKKVVGDVEINSKNEEKRERIKVNTLQKMNKYNIKKSKEKTDNETKVNIYIENYKEKNNNDDSNFKSLRSTVNQSESSLVYNRDLNQDIDKRRVRKINIRNFYKNKNSILLKYKSLGKMELLIN